MKYDFQNLGVSNARYAAALKEAAARVIESGRYLFGPETQTFEQELARACAVSHAVATDNGLNALRLIYDGYMRLGLLNPGDHVIMAANTFIATLLPATQLGLKVKLIDPDPQTFGLDLRMAEQAADEHTRMVVVTHLYGTPSWDFEAAERLRARGIILVEDNAQAIGSSIGGHPTGSLGDAAAISFYPGKNIGALGDSGAVLTSDDKLADTVRTLANYGSHERYHNEYVGYNSRMDELQAAMLRIKLADLPRISADRQAVARAYDKHITNPAIIKPPILTDRAQVWHQYVVRCDSRDGLQNYLTDNGVGTLIHYPVPPHRQPCYRGVFDARTLPLTDRLADTVLSLPIADRTPAEAQEIATILNEYAR